MDKERKAMDKITKLTRLGYQILINVDNEK